jgi:RNA polymerase sigma factor (sigma-70 family)
MASDPLRSRIKALAERTLKAAYRHFFDSDDSNFLELVVERLNPARGEAEVPDPIIIRAVQFVFSLMLHQAFLLDGTDEQERAFHAAQAYLHPKLLYRLRQDETLADDLTQEALIQVWSSIRRQPLREPGAFLSFLLKTGLHLMYRHFAKNKKTLPEPPQQSEGPDAPEPMATSLASVNDIRVVEVEVERRMLLNRLRAFLRQCLEENEKYLRIIEEHFLKGESFKELAQRWNCTAAILHLHKFRALEKLRECLQSLNLDIEDWLNSASGTT